MPFDYQAARAAGYSDGEINAFLAQQQGVAPTAAELARQDAKRRERNTPALLRQFTAGATFNLADELDAAGAAAETWVHDRASRLMGGKGVSYTPRQAYDAVMAAQHDQDAEYREAHPVAATSASIAGALLSPAARLVAAKAAKGASLGARAINSAQAGAATGAAYGFWGADGGLSDRLSGASEGALGGAALGAATPVVAAGAGRVLAPIVDPVLEGARPVLAALKAATAGSGETLEDRARDAGAAMAKAAAERLTKPQAKAAAILERRLAADQAAGVAPTRDGPLYLYGGPNVAGLAENLAQHPGPGMTILQDAADKGLTANLEGYAGDLERAMGGRGDYFATVRNAKAARAANGKPLMEAAFDHPLDPDAFNANFGDLMRRLPPGTWEKAAALARMGGHDPYELGLIRADTFDGFPAGGGSESAAALERRLNAHLEGDGPAMSPDELLPVETPTLRAAHYVKKALDAKLSPLRDAFGHLDLEGNPEAQAISGLRSAWGQAMRKVNPTYDQAMAQWGDESEHLRGLRLGRDVLSNKMDMRAENLAHEHAQLSDQAKAMFQKGVGEALLDAANTKGGLVAMRSMLRSPDVMARVRLAFPTEEAFGDFLATTRQRVADEARNQAMTGNSASYRRLAGGLDLEGDDLGPAVMRDLVTLKPRSAAGRVLERVIPSRTRGVLRDPAANEALARMLTDPVQAAKVRRLVALQRARSVATRAPSVAQRAALALIGAATPSAN